MYSATSVYLYITEKYVELWQIILARLFDSSPARMYSINGSEIIYNNNLKLLV